MLEIRPANINELNAIEQLARATWPITYSEVIPRKQIDYMLNLIYNENSLKNLILNKKHIFLLALIGKLPLGYTSYELNHEGSQALMIHKLYLLPSSQGQGIGKKFLNILAETALKNDNTTLRLQVFYKNHNAISFYERNGFVKTGVKETDIGNGYIILDDVMEKSLS